MTHMCFVRKLNTLSRNKKKVNVMALFEEFHKGSLPIFSLGFGI
jgi:hypothetical protein